MERGRREWCEGLAQPKPAKTAVSGGVGLRERERVGEGVVNLGEERAE